jgi:lysophospholipase L1-like esterase
MELRNKSIIFLGDSITEGHGTTEPDKVFHQLIRAKHGLKNAYNCGIGGTRIAKQSDYSNHKWDLYFGMRVDVLPREADAVVVFGGTNDYGHGDAKIGEPDSCDVCTFFGGLNTLYNSLKERYPDARFVFMTPLEREGQNNPQPPENKILEDYVNALRSFCKDKNLDLIDLFESKVLDPYNADLVPDGLHPNDAGHEKMAEYIATKLLEL